MALTLAEKKAVITGLNDVASKAISVVAADYRGLSVPEMTQLRANARDSGVTIVVIRNRLARRAFENTAYECMRDVLVGPLFLAFSMQEPGAAARVLRDFAKEHEQLEVKALSMDGKLLDASALKAVANLPTYDEALAKFMLVLKAPVTKFVQTLVAPHTKLVRTIAAIAEQKKAA